MNQKAIHKILLIEDNPGDAFLIRKMLAEVKSAFFEVEVLERLAEGLDRLSKGNIDLILLDLSLPDSQGLQTITKTCTAAPDIPVILLTGLNDEELAVQAVRKGAQDYLVKDQVDSNLLERAIRYTFERHRMMQELRSLSLADELTGLYNRRGFLTLAQQQLKMADRNNKGMLLLYADLDGMKWINDNFGHQEGDAALKEIANLLKKTFRDADILARVGGDEFIVLAPDTNKEQAEEFQNRLLQNMQNINIQTDRKYKVSISVGLTYYDPQNPCSIDDLISHADKLMYEQKADKKRN